MVEEDDEDDWEVVEDDEDDGEVVDDDDGEDVGNGNKKHSKHSSEKKIFRKVYFPDSTSNFRLVVFF